MLKRHRTINRDLEKQILISLITSPSVLKEVAPIFDPNLFRLELSRKVGWWIKNYYDVYRTSPGRDIQAIYTQEKGNLQEEVAEQASEFLAALSEEFEQAPPNEAFMLDETRDFFKKAKLEQISINIQAMVEKNSNLPDIEAVLASYNKQMAEVARWVDPFDSEYIHSVFEENENVLFELPGKLGTFLGPIEREFLVGIMGPMKRGKTWWLMEFALHAISHRRRVAYISLEMSDKKCSQRFYQRLTATTKEEEERETTYSLLDCKFNQINQCNRAERLCRIAMPQKDAPNPAYQPCAVCSGVNEDYQVAYYSTSIIRPGLSDHMTQNVVRSFMRQFGRDMFRSISYPPFTSNLKTIQNDLEVLKADNFIPDVVIIDYADILAPETARGEVRHQIDDTWKSLKRMAAENKIAVITATQGNRASLSKDIIEQTDTSEDIRKLAHPDIFFALSQSRRERTIRALRLNILAHRWRHFDPYYNLLVTYNFDVGQPMLDSTFVEWVQEEDNG
jgi:hypothetical protein